MPQINNLYHYSANKTLITILIYNFSSCSVYFVSTIFFIPHILHIGLLDLLNHNKFYYFEIPMIVLSLIGFGLMFYGQYCTLQTKATGTSLCKGYRKILILLGLYYKALVMLSSTYAILSYYLGYQLGIVFVLILSFGVFIINTETFLSHTKKTYMLKTDIKWIFYSLSYSLCITILYYNVINHINDHLIIDNYQTFNFLPLIVFSILFFIGIFQHCMLLKTFNEDHHKIIDYLLSFMENGNVSQSSCIIWKSMVNMMSVMFIMFSFMKYYNFNIPQYISIIIAIILFLSIYNAQTLWFSNTSKEESYEMPD